MSEINEQPESLEPPLATPELVQQISNQLGDNVSTEQVQSVISTWQMMRSGTAVGTIVYDSANKVVAYRVEEMGVPVWRCSAIDGSQWSDMQPTLPWEILYEPE